MCWANFLAGKHNANPGRWKVATYNWKLNHISIQNVSSATVWPQFGVGVFEMDNFGGWGSRFVPIERPSTTSQYLLIQNFALSAAVWPEFNVKLVKLCPRPPGWVDLWVSIKMSAQRFYSTSIPTIGLRWIVWPQYTTRQTDRAIGTGHLCYSIDGLKV